MLTNLSDFSYWSAPTADFMVIADPAVQVRPGDPPCQLYAELHVPPAMLGALPGMWPASLKIECSRETTCPPRGGVSNPLFSGVTLARVN
jgi:hypothetical protein